MNEQAGSNRAAAPGMSSAPAFSRRLRKGGPKRPETFLDAATEAVSPNACSAPQPFSPPCTRTPTGRLKRKGAPDALPISSPVSNNSIERSSRRPCSPPPSSHRSASRPTVLTRLGERSSATPPARTPVLNRLGQRVPTVPRSTSEAETDTSRTPVLERLGPRPKSDIENDVRIIVPENLCFPKIANVCAGASLGVRLDLKALALRARNTAYNPRRFNALFMRLRSPQVTASLFVTGKLNVSGARTEGEARLAIRKLAKKVKKMGYPEARKSSTVIHCMIAMFQVPFQIRLERVAAAHCLFCSYEPELFPALIYKMMSPKVTLMIYINGKVNIMGVKHRSDAVDAFRKIYPVLKNCEKIDGSW